MAILAVLLPLLLVSASSRANPIFGAVQPHVEQEPQINYRLPSNAHPLLYDITLTPEFKKFTYTGVSKITVDVPKKTRDITLHSKNLEINEVTLTYTKVVNGKPQLEKVDLQTPPFDTVPEKDLLIIKPTGDLNINKYTLTLKYKGKLNDDLVGFYRSNYTNEEGKTSWLATTHFEPTGARLAFPCWDEPAIKAEFKITIQHPKEYTALSNMEGERKDGATPNALTTTTFKQTPMMSTYLVAFVVSEYKSVGEPNFRVWTKPHAIKDAEYAKEIGKKALAKLSEFTAYDYYTVMKKMDQISIPDFQAGAMENWGLVTYKESSLLYNTKTTSTSNKQGIATVISHEFAHQWFGNLVSPKWWKYLWLNEGFATYFQYSTTNLVETDWRLMEQFVVSAIQGRAFIVDVSEKTHPMNFDANSPKEIRNLFDGIAYQKAGAVIRMMAHFLTESVFQKGLQNYLNKLKYGVADSDDLFYFIQEVVNKDEKLAKLNLTQIMDNWVNKAGYPIVKVTRDYEKKKAEVTQHKYSFSQSTDETKWWIPINYATSEDSDFTDTKATGWLKPSDEKYEISGVKKEHWIIVNKQQTGYYRVNYDTKNWQLLTKYLKSQDFENIIPVNRAQLIDDAFNLAQIGELDYSIALDLISYLEQESDYIAWTPAYRGLRYLNKMLVNSKEYPKFKLFVAKQLQNVTETVGMQRAADNSDSHIDKLHRVNVLTWSCAFGLKECTTYVSKKLDLWLDDHEKNALDVDLKNAILCAGLREAKKATWTKALEKYKSLKDEAEKPAILSALGCTASKEILQDYADMIFNETRGIKDADTAFMSVLTGSPNGVDVGLETLRKNIQNIRSTEEGEKKLKKYLDEIGNRVVSIEQQTKLGMLAVEEGISTEISSEAIQTTWKNLHWLKMYEEPVNAWLSKLDFTEKKEGNSATSATFATFLLILPVLLIRF